MEVKEEEKKEELEDNSDGEKEEKKENSEKSHPNINYHYVIGGIILIILIFVYLNNGVSVSANVVENHLEGICNDDEGVENNVYEKNQVFAGSDETGRVGFTDLCLKELYDGRLDEIGLLFYLNNIAKYVQFDSEMAKDMDVLLEGFCPASLNQNFEEINPFMLITPYKCPKGCDNGRCIE